MKQTFTEQLEDLVKCWRGATVGFGNYATMRPLELNERDIARACADELEEVLKAQKQALTGTNHAHLVR